MNKKHVRQIAYDSLINLVTEEGINASSKDEIFGCVFGRDSAITVLKILRAHSKKPLPVLLEICKKSLLGLVALQGKEFNIESGEQPGKCIHEFRKNKYDHLITGDKPWFIYPDGVLKNYDSIDATPLTLIAIYKYWEITHDNEFLMTVLPAVEAGLNWIITFGDEDKDFLIEYSIPKDRKHGGLSVQSWTDSHESIRGADGLFPQYPIAPVEVQAFCWLALKLWAKFYTLHSPTFAQKISDYAGSIKKVFNKKFIFLNQDFYYGAQALNGRKIQLQTVTANPMLALWASYYDDGQIQSILDENFIADFVTRAFQKDLFVADAGIRTMSSTSPTFNPNRDCYHNGSFWPMLNGLIVEGLENFGYFKQAKKLKEASLLPILHFGTPIELYIKDQTGFAEYISPYGQSGCRHQAWSAAALLDMTAEG